MSDAGEQQARGGGLTEGGLSSLPGSPQSLPGFPENFAPVVWERFTSLNTKPPRPAISPAEMFWCDGFMPIGDSHLRTLYGTGPAVFAGTAVLWLGFGNIGDTPYGAVLQGDGSVQVFNTNTGAGTAVLSAGTIVSPATGLLGMSQWGSKYLLFCKDQENGYWIWDGALGVLFTSGTVSPDVTLVSPGSDYASLPTITFQTTGSGTGAAFLATIENGAVTNVQVTNAGSGFALGDLVGITFQGGGTDDQAIAGTITPTAGSGGVQEIIVTNGGQGYSSRAHVVFTGGGGTGAVASIGIQNGVVTQIAVVNPGSGYTTPPAVSVSDPGIPGSPSIPGGSGFVGFCSINDGQITSIPIAYGGTGYTTPPTVKILGDGVNATAIAQITAGSVTAVIMNNYGSGYSRALALFEGGNRAANAEIAIMPFGISGTAIETFDSRVWVANGHAASDTPPKDRVIFSSGNSPSDFSASGGAFALTDSFLRVGPHWLKQTNGFLYIGGDSSINYVSNVQTDSSGTTLVNPVNVDPQIGSPWPSSVQVFSRNIMLANSSGVYVSYGGAVQKVSLPLDGFYSLGPIYDDAANFSAAVAQIFGIPVYMLLLPTIDQFFGTLINKLLMFDGRRWWTSQQDVSLYFIATQEINSVLTAWGTDGTNVFRLFQQPKDNFLKVVQSKLYSNPVYWTTKTSRSLSGAAHVYANDTPAVVITIDNERGLGSGNAQLNLTLTGHSTQVTNAGGILVAVTNGLGEPVTIDGPGLDVFGPYPAGQSGRMIGLSVQTSASDMALLSLMLADQIYSPNV